MAISNKIDKLRKIIRKKGKLAVAFSGGSDSSVVAKVAFEELGIDSLAVTINSDTFSKRELEISARVAREIGIKYQVVETSELENEQFVQNSANRCYICKKEEMQAIRLGVVGFKPQNIAFGVNISDFAEHRPGIMALQEDGFFMPLVEAGIKKEEVKPIAKKLGLSNFDLPSTTCLASRIPYGQLITHKKLQQVESAEALFYSLGFSQSRVRNYDSMARIEVSENEIEKVIANKRRIVDELKKIGFAYVTLDLEGYRSGSMNEVL